MGRKGRETLGLLGTLLLKDAYRKEMPLLIDFLDRIRNIEGGDV